MRGLWCQYVDEDEPIRTPLILIYKTGRMGKSHSLSNNLVTKNCVHLSGKSVFQGAYCCCIRLYFWDFI